MSAAACEETRYRHGDQSRSVVDIQRFRTGHTIWRLVNDDINRTQLYAVASRGDRLAVRSAPPRHRRGRLKRRRSGQNASLCVDLDPIMGINSEHVARADYMAGPLASSITICVCARKASTFCKV